jgi:haloacetate dehalogenase
MSLPGFTEGRLAIGGASYFFSQAGSGSPLLLLHGFPETHACWHRIAPRLAEEMAVDLVQLMAELGHERFAVVGHDRGARVAYRLALDHPERVTRAALLNVVPTIDQYERMGAGPSLGYWPWFLLAQPSPFPERLLLAAPGAFLEHIFVSWPSNPHAIGAEQRSAYLQALTASTAAAMCADYRASFHLDREHEAEDRAAGRRIACPALLVTGADEKQLADASEVWRAWTDDLTATQVSGGHFIPEEAPGELSEILAKFLDMCKEGGSSTSMLRR